MSGISILRRLLLKEAVKESGQASGIMSIGDSVRKLVERRLQSYLVSAANKGIDLDKFNESQIKYMLEMNQPYNRAKMQLRKEDAMKSADVFDLKGQKLDPNQPIIGGTQQVENTTGSLTSVPKKEGLAGMEYQTKADMADARLINDMYRTTGPRSLDEDKMYLAEFIAEEAGKVLDDLPASEQKIFIDRAEKALKKNVKKYQDPENMAQGGRIGYKDGPDQPGRRKFMKIMGGLAALPIIGKFFKGAKVAAPAVEAARETAAQAPSYFFDLVNKIKMLGKPGMSIGPRQRTINYKNYELTEDISTGDITVVKQKGDPDFAYEEEVMSLRKGQADEMTKGKTPPDEYEELTVRPDGEGKMKDVEDGIEPESIQEIVEEVTGEAPSIKKAGGGIATMLGE